MCHLFIWKGWREGAVWVTIQNKVDTWVPRALWLTLASRVTVLARETLDTGVPFLPAALQHRVTLVRSNAVSGSEASISIERASRISGTSLVVIGMTAADRRAREREHRGLSTHWIVTRWLILRSPRRPLRHLVAATCHRSLFPVQMFVFKLPQFLFILTDRSTFFLWPHGPHNQGLQFTQCWRKTDFKKEILSILKKNKNCLDVGI